MRASELKTLIMSEFMYGKGYLGLFTEALNSYDVLGIRRSLFTVEFEVKVSKSDLVRELNTVSYVLGSQKNRCILTKKYKHEHYLKKEEHPWIYSKPNLFYFVVPMELEKIAVKGVENTPYGVLAYGDWTYILHFDSGDQERQGHGFKTSIKAGYLHKEKLKDFEVISLLRKASTELYETRKRLLNFSKEGEGD